MNKYEQVITAYNDLTEELNRAPTVGEVRGRVVNNYGQRGTLLIPEISALLKSQGLEVTASSYEGPDWIHAHALATNEGIPMPTDLRDFTMEQVFANPENTLHAAMEGLVLLRDGATEPDLVRQATVGGLARGAAVVLGLKDVAEYKPGDAELAARSAASNHPVLNAARNAITPLIGPSTVISEAAHLEALRGLDPQEIRDIQSLARKELAHMPVIRAATEQLLREAAEFVTSNEEHRGPLVETILKRTATQFSHPLQKEVLAHTVTPYAKTTLRDHMLDLACHGAFAQPDHAVQGVAENLDAGVATSLLR